MNYEVLFRFAKSSQVMREVFRTKLEAIVHAGWLEAKGAKVFIKKK